MTDNNEFETMEVPKDAFINMAYEIVMESDRHDVNLPEGTTDEFYDKMSTSDVDCCEIIDGDTVAIHSTTKVREIIDKIPATHWQPAEYKTRDVDVLYTISLNMGGLGNAHLYAEVM